MAEEGGTSSGFSYNYNGNNAKQQLGPGVQNIVCSGIMAYFFYKYGWKNPDLENTGTCWAKDGQDVGTAIDIPGSSGYEEVSK